MGILEAVDKQKKLLPIREDWADIDISDALKEVRFDPETLASEVAADYIAGLMDLYRDAGGKKDIVEDIVERHFTISDEWNVERIRQRLKPALPIVQKPRMVPWALYEIIAEEVRRELAEIKGLEDKTNPTVFPFLIGVYSLIAQPLVVLSSSLLSIEDLIENVNTFSKGLNTVTIMETVQRGVYDERSELMKATFRRHQQEQPLQALEQRVRAQGRSDTEAVISAICARDLATVCGALVGGSLLRGQRLRYIEITGDPRETTEISIYYPVSYRSRFQPSLFSDSIGLALTARHDRVSKWRQGYIRDHLDAAIAPLNAVALKILSERIETLTRAEEAEIRIKRLRELARDASHHVKNPASALLGILRRLSPDEEEIFREVPEYGHEIAYRHRTIIKEIAGEYNTEGIAPRERQRRLTERYDAYQRRFRSVYEERETALARRVFDVVCGTYSRARMNASKPIVDGLIAKIERQEALEKEEIQSLRVHYERLTTGLENAERIAEEIIERTKGLSEMAKGEETREVLTKEPLNLYDIVECGLFLMRTQPDRPEVVVDIATHARPRSDKNTVQSAVENITWNAYEAIQGKAGLDPQFKGETIVVSYDEQRNTLYIGNTGPVIPDHRIPEIFAIGTRTGNARGELKRATGTGTSMALKRDLFATLEQTLTCYNAGEVVALRERYEAFRRYNITTVFGIQF
jgi:signal transduction histidine kinase